MKADVTKGRLTDSEARKAAVEAGVGKILAFEAENFKKIRLLRLDRLGNLVEFTGKNGQGKTSALDALWFLLKGKAALPTKALRNGAERLKVKGDLGAFTVTRTLGSESALPSLTLEMAKGKTAWDTPQAMLDGIVGELAFDPLEFIRMPAKTQVETLRKAVKLDLKDTFTLPDGTVLTGVEAINAANQKDYDERTLRNKEAKQLAAELSAMQVLEGLPKEKLDEAAILKALNEAGEANRQAQVTFRAKQELSTAVDAARRQFEANERLIESVAEKIAEMKRQLEMTVQMEKNALAERKKLESGLAEAEKSFEAAPNGEPVDVTALTVELQSAQRTNRAIDAREAWQRTSDQLRKKQGEADELTRRMEAREEKKRNALKNAKIPIDGLVMEETRVTFNGLPLENLGEGEAIRMSTRLGMALNPTLRVMRIPHGEALDEDGMKILADLAAENDYQIWISRVDSSGKIGIVMVDGLVESRNEETE